MAAIEIPCIPFPELPEPLVITLPGGAKLSGFLDFSKGMPTQCSVNFSLLQQLAPMLAALKPMLDILGVIKALKGLTEVPPDPAELKSALEKIAGLLIALTPAGMAITIAGVLKLVVGFLKCFIEQLEAAVKFQADIALAKAKVEAEGEGANLVLKASLACSEANAEIAMRQAFGALGPIAPILDLVNTLAGIAGLSLAMPQLSVSADGDAIAAIASMREAITALEDVVKSLPS